MFLYILRRIFWGVVTLWVIVTLTFMLMHSVPGGPFDSASFQQANETVRANQIAKFGLDRPFHEQYVIYLKNLLKGDLGVSITYTPRTVNMIIARGFPVSAKLGLISIAISVTIGIVTGIWAALKRSKWQDNFVKVMTTIGITIPSFVLATLLIYLFAVKLRWLPSYGFRSLRHAILPAFALSFGSIAFLARLTRSSMLDVIRQDYIRTARAKGLSRNKVIYKHALKNALLPIITFLGPMVAALLTGSFIIEKIFSVPGMGGEMVSAIGNRDYMMILGLTTFFSIILITTYIIVDIIYVLLDPRVKFD
jgi:oligopeptide transport system permease protein